ncbi:FG-GAP repeat domain-containing protein [Nostocoides jenkinsii]|uniref:VCBS repeat-containing protein n=1 Tax=Nostocoides jenkinsii Ben 74 TaxID=1193518 RepID=A0A077M9U2_9MICO|nr:VCBS repeat-containing protein [Tetrasphaera jenkinsii]CCI53384.1 hypothetical protein BN13_390001 [Tetrasphaera jenkinsii Ben 74]
MLRNSLPASNGWDREKSAPIAGDFNGDGRADLAILHGAGGTDVNVWMLNGSITSPLSGTPRLAQVLPSGAGWNLVSEKVSAGDYNGDGAADLAILHAAGATGMYLWKINGAKTTTSLSAAPVKGATSAGTAGWVFGSTQPVSGDVNGDGAADLTLLHAAPDAGVNLWGVWGAKSSAALTGSPGLIKSLPATSGWRYAYAKGV